MKIPVFSIVLLTTLSASEPLRQKIVVTGTPGPMPLEEADRSVRALDVAPLRLITNTFADLLKLDSSVDLRQRAPNGVQGDVSIRGASFGQTLILLDGLRLNDAQSGHHNLDLPVPLEAIASVEILKGSGSTLYGSDAVGGVINFVSRRPETSEMRIQTAGGSFGTNQQRVTIGFLPGRRRDRIAQQFSVFRDFSTGFSRNRDYRNLSASSSTHITTPLGGTHVVLAYRDSPFGADQFYGNFNSWERTKTWWVAARQNLGASTDLGFAWRRHTDLFVLYRDRPQVFTNRHLAESVQLSLRRRDTLAPNLRLFYGAEGFRDSVASNNLGRHDRSRGAIYAVADLRAVRRFSLSAGLRDEVYGSGNHQFSPTLSGGAWLNSATKLRASASRAFRLPTYTDLYYQDPANRGSADLRPETAWSYEAGADFNPGGRIRAGVSVFQRRETDGIDYVRNNAADIWRATNFQSLRFTGVEAELQVRLPGSQTVELQYTGLRGAQEILSGRQSKYVFNYPVNSGIVSWQGTLGSAWVARTRIGVVERFQRNPYTLWDLYGSRSRGRVRPFLQLTNLSASQYQEIPGVATPGRAILGGLELIVFGPH